jgi:hypothetical protein
MSKQIATIPKNAREKIIFSLNEYKGKNYLDMRIFTANDNGGQDIPTKKGLTLTVDLYPQFKAVMAQVEAAIITQGWLDREDLETGL